MQNGTFQQFIFSKIQVLVTKLNTISALQYVLYVLTLVRNYAYTTSSTAQLVRASALRIVVIYNVTAG